MVTVDFRLLMLFGLVLRLVWITVIFVLIMGVCVLIFGEFSCVIVAGFCDTLL